MKTYDEFELIQAATDNWHAVLDEGFRRQEECAKRIERLRMDLQHAEAKYASAQRVIEAARKVARNLP